MKKKYIVAMCIALVFMILISTLIIVLNKAKSTKRIEPIENTYIAYVKINPLIKITFKIECLEDKCDDPYVNKFELLNDDAKSIYKNLELNDKNLKEFLGIIANIAEDSGLEFEKIDIYTTWNESNYFKNIDSKWVTNIKVIEEDKLNDLPDELKDNFEKYTVTFNSDGGTVINNQIIEKGEKVNNPVNPSRNGYTFVEWQLDNKTYDFNENVLKDISLKAIWKLNEINKPINSINKTEKNEQEKQSEKEPEKESEKQPDIQPEKPKEVVTIDFTGKYTTEGGYIQLKSDNTCYYMYQGIEPLELGSYPCTYSIKECSNPRTCPIKNALIYISMNYPDGNIGDGIPFTVTTNFILETAIGLGENGEVWTVKFKK